MNIPNYHLIDIKFLGPTNTKGARVKITSHRFKQSITVGYDYNLGYVVEQVYYLLAVLGHNIIGMGETKDGFVLVSTTFEPLK